WIGAGLGALLLTLLTTENFGQVRWLQWRDEWVARSYTVILSIGKVQQHLDEAIANQRGYLLTGNRVFLEPYLDAVREVSLQLQLLRKLIGDNPAESARMQALSEAIGNRIADLSDAVAERDAAGTMAAADWILNRQVLFKDEAVRRRASDIEA